MHHYWQIESGFESAFESVIEPVYQPVLESVFDPVFSPFLSAVDDQVLGPDSKNSILEPILEFVSAVMTRDPHFEEIWAHYRTVLELTIESPAEASVIIPSSFEPLPKISDLDNEETTRVKSGSDGKTYSWR